jgi:PilZ domain
MMTEKCELERPPAEMVELVLDLIRRDYGGRQERQSPRHGLVTEVPAVPIDGDLQQVGEPFIALTRNISTRGICLVHTEPIYHGWLRLKIKSRDDYVGRETELCAKVLRCRPLKNYFEIACTFVLRLS